MTTSFVPSSFDELFRQYDDQRRLRLTKVILPIFIVITFFGFIQTLITRNGSKIPTVYILQGSSLGILIILFIIAYLAARSRYSDWASPLTQLATSLAVISIQVAIMLPLLAPGQHYSGQYQDITYFASFGILVVLTGVIGSPLGVILMATGNSIALATVCIILNAYGRFADQGVNWYSTIGFQFICQWALAGLMLGILGGYRQVIKELGSANMEVIHAKQIDDLKNQFISNVNHELRNPIMAMMGGLALMRQRVKRNGGTPELEDIINRTETIATHLRTMVQSILETHQLDTPVAPKEPIAVVIRAALTQAADIVINAEPQASTHELRVTIPKDLTIWGDDFRLRQIFSNLLSNAVKYSSPGTPIEVKATVIAKNPDNRHNDDSEMVEITIRDYGLGIPAEHITVLFNRFVRLPRDMISTVIGNGLGLYLCRRYAESMEGTIEVTSSGVPGEGSCFILRLPQPSAKQLIASQ